MRTKHLKRGSECQSLSAFLPLGTLSFTAVPTTGHRKELIGSFPYRQERKDEQDAQFELIFEVFVIETIVPHCVQLLSQGES